MPNLPILNEILCEIPKTSSYKQGKQERDYSAMRSNAQCTIRAHTVSHSDRCHNAFSCNCGKLVVFNGVFSKNSDEN